jgi:cell division protease FtsH
MLKKLLRGARAHYVLSIAVMVTVSLLLCVIALSGKASRESDARKSPEALQFERAPDEWLTHQKNIAEFRNALNAGNLSAVGLDSVEPGLVLYTLKSGEKGSTIVPGCSMLGCAGTALDSLGDKSAQADFALVRVEVDPRTASRRFLDILTGLLSPVLGVAALVGACFVGIRLQRGMGGAASRLAIRPKTQFTDAIGQDEAKAAQPRQSVYEGPRALRESRRRGATRRVAGRAARHRQDASRQGACRRNQSQFHLGRWLVLYSDLLRRWSQQGQGSLQTRAQERAVRIVHR